MSIRLRLAVWYGALASLVLLVTALFSYAFHTRGHYDDRDLALITSVNHTTVEASTTSASPHLVSEAGGLDITLRLYNRTGEVVDSQSGTEPAPEIDPGEIIAFPSGPAFDAVAGLARPLTEANLNVDEGAFGLAEAGGQRWRIYVEPLGDATSPPDGYVAALTPLGALDTAIATFRTRLLALGIISTVAGLVGGRLIAGGALRPISKIARTAHAIELSRDFTKRIETLNHQDELGHLAVTFNQMLASLEEAYQAQQRFVADASHELRAPLTAIQANLELLERQPDAPPAARQEAVQEAHREAHRLARLVRDLLVLARADTKANLPRERVELERVVLESMREMRTAAPQHDLILDELTPVVVMGHPDRLKQLLVILLDNAIKYTPRGGQISVSLTQGDRLAVLQVRDRGIGIPASALPHLFERFYRADPARSRDPGGTGLGLSIAQWIVEQHDGRIGVESEEGVGTQVTVALPLHRP